MIATAARVAKGLVSLLGFLLVLQLAAPAPIGGHLTMSIVHGSSMQPTYSTGDMVFSVRRTTYDVGDVVVYPTDGGDVIHRIVGGNATDGFTTRGDNRAAVDEWTPAAADVGGTPLVRVPRAGGLLLVLQDALGPQGLFMLSLLALGMAARPRSAARGSRVRWPATVREAALASAALSVGAGAVAVWLLRAPAVPDLGVRAAVGTMLFGALGLLAAMAIGQLLHVRARTWATDLALGRRVVDVDDVDRTNRTVAPVSTARALRRAADRTGNPVLRHAVDETTTTYEVIAGEVVIVLTCGPSTVTAGLPPHLTIRSTT